MSGNLYSLPSGQPVALSAEQIDKLIAMRDGTAALLYLALRNDSACTIEQAALRLGISRQTAEKAVEALTREGLLTPADTGKRTGLVSDALPIYTASDIAREMDKRSDFSDLVTVAQDALGKIFSPADLQALYVIYDWRGLPPGVIALLIHHCIADYKVRYGEDKRPTMRQIDKQAAYWEEKGLFTEELAEQFVKQQAQARKLTSQYAAKLQIYGRAPTATEIKYLEEWASLGFDPDVIYEAYDITVVKTGKLTWKYCDTILKSWHEQGIHTAGALAKAKSPAGQADKNPGTNAMERRLKQMNGG